VLRFGVHFTMAPAFFGGVLWLVTAVVFSAILSRVLS